MTEIKTPQVYDNEHTVGVALQKSKINREDLYITTKYGSGDLRTAFISSLKKVYLIRVWIKAHLQIANSWD